MMKKLMIALSVVLYAGTSYGQGQVNFQNFEALTDPSRGFYNWDGKGFGAGYTAGLFLVVDGNVGVGPLGTTTFFTDPGAEFLVNPVDVTLPGNPGGTTVILRVRVWDTSAGSFDGAVAQGRLGGYGESADFSQALGGDPGGGGTPTPPTFLQGPGFMIIPEPSAVTFGIIGGLVFLFHRRK